MSLDNTISIDKLELASLLAERELINEVKSTFSPVNSVTDSPVTDVIAEEILTVSTPEGVFYKPYYQDKFNNLLDEFTEIIEKTKIK